MDPPIQIAEKPPSRSSNLLKQETARPSQFSQGGTPLRFQKALKQFNAFVNFTNRFVRYRCDGSGPGARGYLGGPRQCLRIDILPDVRHFAISNGNGEDPMVLERPYSWL